MSETSPSTDERHDVRVLLVDDHDLFRTGLRNLLEGQGIHIVGEAAGGSEALQIVRETAPDVVVTGPRTLTVSAIAYSIRGNTASGLPAGPGVAAVDPNVIPLGTRMFVPGYGEAVAADTGSAIRGAVIDLWFPTTAAALRWGRKTVVIQLR